MSNAIFEPDLSNSRSLNASYSALRWKNVFELIDQSDNIHVIV